MESQCKEYYDDCLSQENARTCGIPLLNISVSCAIDTDNGVRFSSKPLYASKSEAQRKKKWRKIQKCDKDACITSVGNFFFGNDHDFTHTRRVSFRRSRYSLVQVSSRIEVDITPWISRRNHYPRWSVKYSRRWIQFIFKFELLHNIYGQFKINFE